MPRKVLRWQHLPSNGKARYLAFQLAPHGAFEIGMIAGNLYKMTHLFELKTYLKKFYLKLDKEKMTLFEAIAFALHNSQGICLVCLFL